MPEKLSKGAELELAKPTYVEVAVSHGPATISICWTGLAAVIRQARFHFQTDQSLDTIFSPMMPPAIIARHASRAQDADSPNK